MVTINRI